MLSAIATWSLFAAASCTTINQHLLLLLLLFFLIYDNTRERVMTLHLLDFLGGRFFLCMYHHTTAFRQIRRTAVNDTPRDKKRNMRNWIA